MDLDANTINMLMNLDPVELTSSPEKLDMIIEYNRRLLSAYERGEKVVTHDVPKIDLTKIGLSKPITIKRRKGL